MPGHLQAAASGHLLRHPTTGHLANGCSDCTCDESTLATVVATIDLTGCSQPVSCTRGYDGGITLANSNPDYCYYGGGSEPFCHVTDDTSTDLQLINDPTLGCIWLFQARYVPDLPGAPAGGVADVLTAYRTFAGTKFGAYTKLSGCATGVSIV